MLVLIDPMNDLLALIVHHGYIIICLVVFAEAIGVPVPGAVALVAGGAAAASGALYGPAVALLAVRWFWPTRCCTFLGAVRDGQF